MQSLRQNLSISFPALLLLAACGAGVNVGGPQNSPGTDAGNADAASPQTEGGSPDNLGNPSMGPQPEAGAQAPSGPCATAGGTCISASVGCSSPQEPSLTNACGDPSVLKCCVPLVAPGPSTATADATGLMKASAYASGNVACTTDADCCVAFDGCRNEAFVVGVTDKDKVASLLAGYDMWAQSSSASFSAGCTGCVPPPVQVSCVQQKCTGLALRINDFKNPMSNPWLPWLTDHCGAIAGAPAPHSTGSMLGCGG